MKAIEDLCDYIDEELHDSEKYIRKAMACKDENPNMAALYARLSAEEMTHVNLLHEQVVVLINEYKKLHGEPPEQMKWRYEYIHKKHTDKATEIKIMQGLFKGQ